VLPPELLRTLPEWRALVVHGNLSPVVVRLRMAWRRHDYRHAYRAYRAPRQPLALTAEGERPGVEGLGPDVSEPLAPLPEVSASWHWDEPEVDPADSDLKSLKAKVDAVTRTQHEQAAALNDMAELRRQVEKILDLIAEEDESSRPWFWLTMPEREREEKLSELTDWVETVLRVQYPDYLADQIRPCWPNHPETRWELSWLYQLWSAAYLGARPGLKDAADWHDRWFPGVSRRLSVIT
jgi:hypothetical protein